jgi:hypothetical protein
VGKNNGEWNRVLFWLASESATGGLALSCRHGVVLDYCRKKNSEVELNMAFVSRLLTDTNAY